MYKFDLPLDTREANAIARRRNCEEQRKSRIFDARTRQIGKSKHNFKINKLSQGGGPYLIEKENANSRPLLVHCTRPQETKLNTAGVQKQLGLLYLNDYH